MRVAILDKSHMGYALNLLKADGWTQDCLIYTVLPLRVRSFFRFLSNSDGKCQIA